MALKGNILGPILFLFIFNVPHFLLKYYLLIKGHTIGALFIKQMEKSNLMPKVSYALSIVGYG